MRIAIVGSGISGLACAHWLHPLHEISVFEAEDWIGGHTHTVPVAVDGRVHAVDTGFIVFNERTYPHFIALLRELGVASKPTTMGFSVRCEGSGIEYNGGSLSGLFAQRRNLLRPAFHRMLRDVLRFYREAPGLLAEANQKLTLGEYLDGARYGREFVQLHLLPMGAAIWSCAPARMREFPVQSLVRFLANHGLLQLRDRPPWRVVEGGSARYVEALVAPFRDRIHARCPVRSVRRGPEGVEVVTARHGALRFDQVVLATHSDQALALLADPTPAERRILGAIRTQENEVVLHTDARLLPRRRRARAAWNVHLPRAERESVSVTYSMNLLQGLDTREEICVTLNRSDEIDPRRILGSWRVHHPLFDAAAFRAQGERGHICGVGRTHYAGAWWGYGFHEDGVRSARVVARRLGARPA